MKRYACSILYKYNDTEFSALIKLALEKLGFNPQFMDVYFDGMKSPIDDVPYDFDYLHTLLKRSSGTITIKSQLYDEEKRETNNWFRCKLTVDSPFGLDTCSFEWSNTNFTFLLSDKHFNSFLSSPNLIYCYVYDQYDSMSQSNDKIDSFIVNYPEQAYKTIKNYMNDDVIDISQHWGRFISTRGITFMAAPLMWFGNEYFKIIPQKSLLKFTGASLFNHPMFDLVQIGLFDLYDDPSKKENREKQKYFWKTFNLQEKAEQYEKDRPFDFIAWHNKKAALKKKK